MPVAITRPAPLSVEGFESVNVQVTESVKTDARGRFVFPRVLAGKGWIGNDLPPMMGKTRWPIACRSSTLATLPLGETVHLDIGRSGRPVVGKLRPPSGTLEVPWAIANITVQNQPASAAEPQRRFLATVDRDGAFRLEDVPPGNYFLDVSFDGRFETHLVLYLRFSVSNTDGRSPARPLDLGTLMLLYQQGVRPFR